MLEKIIGFGDPAQLNNLPRPIVFTNGVFDILHRGHVTYLHQARALGASLLVAVNSDQSTRMLGKGDDRPLNPEIDRAIVVAALESVTAVMIFEERTPLDTIQMVKPDIYVKGGDYDVTKLAETALVESWGGQGIAIPFVDGYSSTRTISRIRGIIR